MAAPARGSNLATTGAGEDFRRMRLELSALRLPELVHTDFRAVAVESAVIWRNCALSPLTSDAGRRACRSLMRVQALEWRRLTARQHRERATTRWRIQLPCKKQKSPWPSGSN